ncbi:MAG: FecR domain-containing protein [Candidatus Marinimicrobia bacterium]|nr:FecR domain-containing protein [Candidatus Neomarinimicrobiota bacterium]
MKSIHRILASAAIFLSAVLLFADSPIDRQYFGSITLPLGRVLVQHEVSDDWMNAGYKDSVHIREKVKTLAKSRCEITLKERAILRIGEKTVIEIVPALESRKQVTIRSGNAWVGLLWDDPNSTIRVRTPAAVCAIRGTVCRISCDSVYTHCLVYDGTVFITPIKLGTEEEEDSSFVVNAGEELLLIGDFEKYKKAQEEAFRKFEEQELDELERFKREQEEEFHEFKRVDEKAFQQFKSFYFSSKQFDQEADRKIDWVQWNIERDKIVNK